LKELVEDARDIIVESSPGNTVWLDRADVALTTKG